jgi:hypothetical protein
VETGEPGRVHGSGQLGLDHGTAARNTRSQHGRCRLPQQAGRGDRVGGECFDRRLDLNDRLVSNNGWGDVRYRRHRHRYRPVQAFRRE